MAKWDGVHRITITTAEYGYDVQIDVDCSCSATIVGGFDYQAPWAGEGRDKGIVDFDELAALVAQHRGDGS